MNEDSVFVDWLTIKQHHATPQVIVNDGEVVLFDATGRERFARVSAARIRGSHEASIFLRCDGRTVWASGNPGRFGRKDNLFNVGLAATVARLNDRVVQSIGLAPFAVGDAISDKARWSGAELTRVDLTSNYALGSEYHARAFINWLQGRAKKRVRRGDSGSESVWWASSREMLKAYLKGAEMLAHGMPVSDRRVQWCQDNGIVRVEWEGKRRLLDDLELNKLGDWSMGKVVEIFRDRTAMIRSIDRSGEAGVIDSLPKRLRVHAAAWFGGEDLRSVCSNGSFYRYRRALLDYGIDISQRRSAVVLNIRPIELELRAVTPPDWYSFDEEEAA